MAESFVGHNLRIARVFRGWTQEQLAAEVEVSQAYINKLETGSSQPSTLMLGILAQVLNFEPGWFVAPLVDEFREAEVHFRRRKTAPARSRSHAIAHGTLFCKVLSRLNDEVNLPKPVLPQIPFNSLSEAEAAADATRRTLGLPADAPIANLVRLVESAGVVVAHFEGESEKLDAFSRGGVHKIAVLNTQKGSTSRTRFDLGHEIGHLVGHPDRETGDSETEQQANRFASAFLLPRGGFLREFPRTTRLNWDLVWSLKRRWRVSAAAIVHRAHSLKLLDAREYRSANIYLRKRGYHLGEPWEPDEEHATVVRDAIRLVTGGSKSSFERLARNVGMSADTLSTVVGVPLPDSHLQLVK